MKLHLKKSIFYVILIFCLYNTSVAQTERVFQAIPGYTYNFDGIIIKNDSIITGLKIPIKRIKSIEYNKNNKVIIVRTDILIVCKDLKLLKFRSCN